MVPYDVSRRKENIMTQVAKKSAPAPKAKAVVKSAELVVTDKEISYNEIWSFVQQHAGGNEANVRIVPLDNVDIASASPVPFGYGGRDRRCPTKHPRLDAQAVSKATRPLRPCSIRPRLLDTRARSLSASTP
jgi:hypothetical protein